VQSKRKELYFVDYIHTPCARLNWQFSVSFQVHIKSHHHIIVSYLLITFAALLLQSRSQLLHRTTHARFKPFDVFREERERRRIVCNKKMSSPTHCTHAVTQELCLSSPALPCDHLSRSLLSPSTDSAVNGCIDNIPSHCSPSDIVVDTVSSCQLSAEKYSCEHFGADKLERKFNITEAFSNQSNLRTEFPTDTVKEETTDGGCFAYDRYVVLLLLMS